MVERTCLDEGARVCWHALDFGLVVVQNGLHLLDPLLVLLHGLHARHHVRLRSQDVGETESKERQGNNETHVDGLDGIVQTAILVVLLGRRLRGTEAVCKRTELCERGFSTLSTYLRRTAAREKPPPAPA